VGRTYIGVDPGVSGGIAGVDEAGSIVFAVKMPDTVAGLLSVLTQRGGNAIALLEFVHATPQMGVRSAFTFGHGVGRLEASLEATGIPYSEIAPAKWQRLMDCRTGGNKNVTKAWAAIRWPMTKVTHAIADALILAECCRVLEARRRVDNDSRKSAR
jgi:hypothetical protein